jgi:hypothetical protein
MTPAEPHPPAVPPAPAQAGSPAASAGQGRAPWRWYNKLAAVLFATICLEIGCYLAVFPWTSSTTAFAAFHPGWRQYLDNLFVRGAISGLGIVNLYIAVIEILRLRRFAGR